MGKVEGGRGKFLMFVSSYVNVGTLQDRLQQNQRPASLSAGDRDKEILNAGSCTAASPGAGNQQAFMERGPVAVDCRCGMWRRFVRAFVLPEVIRRLFSLTGVLRAAWHQRLCLSQRRREEPGVRGGASPGFCPG